MEFFIIIPMIYAHVNFKNKIAINKFQITNIFFSQNKYFNKYKSIHFSPILYLNDYNITNTSK